MQESASQFDSVRPRPKGGSMAEIFLTPMRTQRTHLHVCGREVITRGRFVKVASLDGEKYLFLDDPKPVIEGVRASGIRANLFTFLQRLPDPSPKFSYAFEMDNLAAMPVTSFDDWWNNQIRSYARNRARQAEKRGVTLRQIPFDDETVRGIWEIYNECSVRQGKAFPHYGTDLETVRKIKATFLEASIFIGAFFENKMIGFAKLVADQTGTQANLMHILSLVSHKEKAPTNALIGESVRVCAERGIKYLVYQNFAYGNKQGDGLSKFKEENGFQRFDVPRYYIPLNRWGAVALSAKLHLPLADRLPPHLATSLRNFRSAWYRKKSLTKTGTV